MLARKRLIAGLVACLATVVAVALGAAAGPGARSAEAAATAAATKPGSDKVIMFSSDGMRQDLMERYAGLGLMPTYSELMGTGVSAPAGLLQGFPPNTGVGWSSMATGTWPGEHGSTNNTFHRTGSSFTGRTSAFSTGILQADTIQQAAERAGETVASIEWVASRGLVPSLKGPVVDFRDFFSRRGVLLNFDLPGQPAGANEFGVDYQRVTLDPASGWTNVPASFSPAMQEQLAVLNTTSGAFLANVNRFYDLYIYDSTNDGTTNYDRVLVVPASSKDGSQAVADLAAGDWADVKVTLTDTRAGQTAGFYLKAIDIAPDLSRFRIYFTSIARVIATYNACACAATFEETLASRFPTSTAADFAPLEAGIVDEDTYVEQGLMWKDAHFAYLRYILGTAPVPTVDGGSLPGLGVQADLLMLGTPVTDEFSHQFMALVTPTDLDGDPNPYFDDVSDDNVPDKRLKVREGYIRSAYMEADHTLELGRTLMGKEDTTAFGASDHGFAPQWRAINARKVLFDAKVDGISLHASGATATSNCGAVATDLAKACWAGGTVQIYVNPTLPAGTTYEEVRAAALQAFASLTDPANPGKQVMSAVFLKEQLRNVDGSDSLHPNRSGDVVAVSRPPYQYDAATGGVPIAFSQFFGQHGYLPGLANRARNVDMHGTFVAAGPGIRSLLNGAGKVRAIDIAPTVAFLLDIPGPQNARGRILYGILQKPHMLREITILDISDYHGQLVPLQEAADTVGPTFAIGGAAFLRPWFDVYRAEAPNGSITVAGGDSVGATPPISNFFGDKPTIEFMNLMKFNADGLGNHNFDRGQQYLREELIPLARFDFVSSNIVDAAGATPAEWSPSKTYRFGDVRLGLIGFSNTDIPILTFPGALGPFHVGDPVAAVNAEAAKLAGKVDAVVALGHLGATAGTVSPLGVLTNPTGPLLDLADAVAGVDAVIGDHTDFQVLDLRGNGVLVTENRSKGIRLTRLRLVVDEAAGEVVYMTADFHKPWDIGVTPHPGIQARIDQLNAQLAPILNTIIGTSTVPIPRADACGQSAGRTCESRVGNVTTDSMRRTYGTDFAITNSGGLRADLTCPAVNNPNDFCPTFTPPPFPITRGQVLTVLPFGNEVVTYQLNGGELKSLLENGVSRMPAVDGRFPQVSGLCFTYDITQAAGSRVLSAVRAAANGSCTPTPVDLTAASTYSIAANDFMTEGGDGYPNFSARMTTRDVMDEVLADHIGATSPISPSIQGRIVCTGAGCPTVTP